MTAIGNVLVGIVAAEHLWFLVLEMFLWTRPIGLRTFRQSEEKARASAPLAANQGLYNGFLAAGLVWGLLASPPEFAVSIKVFFLTCVVIAGVVGARPRRAGGARGPGPAPRPTRARVRRTIMHVKPEEAPCA
jgi:putative membrane protein